MNRFRTKKRTTKDDVSAPRPSMDSETAGPFKLFGKKKLPDSDSKQDLDLDAALPSSDDFRTSLLMTGLSARFSMLREQDDPHSKIGKASDDSVLFPKRQSRLMEFGYASGLQDIAEIESIQASTFDRLNSSHGSEDPDNVNIMDRSRPNDGNNLFGGRQKIYRLGAGAKTGSNGMGGRILYDEDVAKSAFQKWKQSERERASFEDRNDDTLESESAFDYNKKRATNSTTSSGASAGRNSTAATSIASQVHSSKDGQSTIPPSASNVERSFTRTRRLYEQGLTQDLQDQQSSALSRMDTLSKSHRNKTNADGMPIPSPTSSTFGDRVMERRTVLTKGSAPNLRSFTPPTSATSQQTPIEPVPKFPAEQRTNFGVSPPLSPPISEADDHPMLSIQPNDRGKATAMGVFNRPSHQYDDSKFAQRQQQMRKGRDVSDTQSQTGARSSQEASRSRSSSMQRTLRDRVDATPNRTDRSGKKDYQASSFFDDSDDASGPSGYSNLTSSLGPQLSVSRPNDDDHPAFRKSALPTPLSLSSRASDDNSSVEDKADLSFRVKNEPPEHSPTLGPGPGAGLSGMVRQHLRGDSNASSIYDAANQTPDADSRQQSGSPDSKRQANHARNTSWGLQEDEFANDSGTWTPTNQTKPTPRGEQDEFARHLADGARRVREKLTSYAEPDSEHSPPPVPPAESSKDLAGARTNALGILRSKSSRTSLFDRGRDRDSDSKSKTGKSPAPSNRTASGETAASEQPPVPLPKDDNMHAGLKAFRQARRELQKMKELEAQQRHGGSPQKPSPQLERPAAQRAFSQDPSVSPPSYPQAGFSGRRQAAAERDRSGSDSSREGLDRQRRMPPRGVAHTGGQSPTRNKKRDISEPAYLSDKRLHPSSLPGATVSTPNLHAPVGAPPLPPINPRRKNGLTGQSRRSGEQAAPGDGVGAYDESGDERRPLYRAASDENGDRSRHYPPAPTHRPPLPHANMSSNSLPGGMI